MAQISAGNPVKEKRLVFEKVEQDPLSNPALFGLVSDDDVHVDTQTTSGRVSVNIDGGWDSDEEKDIPTNIEAETPPDTEETKSDKAPPFAEDAQEEYVMDPNNTIEANIARANKKKKKIDIRAELTSDSQDIDGLLLFQSKEHNETEHITKIDEELLTVGDEDLETVSDKKKEEDKKKSLEALLAETDDMFKAVEEQQDELEKLDMNVDDNFNFEQYINQQVADKTDD